MAEQRTNRIRFYSNLVQLVDEKIARKAMSYDYRSLHLCSEEHRITAEQMFKEARSHSKEEKERRRRALQNAVTTLALERLKYATMLSNGTANERTKERQELEIKRLEQLKSQRQRRYKEVA